MREDYTPQAKRECQDPVSSQHIPILPYHEELAQHTVKSASVYSIPGTRMELRYISSRQAQDTVTTTGIGSNETENQELDTLLRLSDSRQSDLIPGVYEGGLKVWECAFDLVQYMMESDLEFSGKSVLELGCGVGLPGIYSLMKGAKRVDFQDYNHAVINYVTIPNTILNAPGAGGGEMVRERCNFYSGDWGSVRIPNKYDIILTTETIYSEESQPRLLAALKELSSAGGTGGVVYVAAKIYYFGVGGSVNSFCSLLEKDGTFCVCECERIETGVPRVILKLTHKI